MFAAVLAVGGHVPPAMSATPDDGDRSDRYIVVLREGTDVDAVVEDHSRADGARATHRYRYGIRGYAATIPEDRLAAIRSDPRVAFVSEDGLLALTAQTLPTGVNRIDGDISSTVSGNGSGSVNVNVAVIDIGIESTHPDLRVKTGPNCSAPGTIYNPWHGTVVAGVIGAKDNTAGVVGVVPGTTLYAVRVTDFFAQTPFSDVICAIDWVTSTRKDKDRTNDIAVANMSLIGQGSDDGSCGQLNSDALHAAICASTSAGVTYVVAAGNSAEDFQTWVPAAYNEVLTVTAVSDSDGKPGQLGTPPACTTGEVDDASASFSNFATLEEDQQHTIAAPGVCIYTTTVVGSYGTFKGTSLAAPHVTGTVALCISRRTCSGIPSQIIQRIRNDAAAYNQANILYGFWGDPIRPIPGRYYGFLLRAGGY